MKRNTRRWLCTVSALTFGLAILGCQPSASPDGAGCLPIRPGEPIYDLVWVDDPVSLMVVSIVGPLDAASPGTLNITEVDWPSRSQRIALSVPSAHGSQIVSDGTFYWMLEDGIWEQKEGQASPVRRAAITNAEANVESWVVAGDAVLVMRADRGNQVDAYGDSDTASSVWAQPDPAAYHLWAAADGSTVVVSKKATSDANAQLDVHDRLGNVHTVATGIGLPTVRWVSQNGSQIAFQQFNGTLFFAPVDGSSAPTAITGIPAGADAVSAPSSDGLVAYSGGGSGRSNVCFASDLPAQAVR